MTLHWTPLPVECIYHGAAPLPPLSTVLVAYPAARLPIIGVFYVVLWCDQLPPVTSLLPDFNGFGNSVVLGLVCGLSLPRSHFQKERSNGLWC